MLTWLLGSPIHIQGTSLYSILNERNINQCNVRFEGYFCVFIFFIDAHIPNIWYQSSVSNECTMMLQMVYDAKSECQW